MVEQFINEKGQLSYRFRYATDDDSNPPMHALAQWVKIAQEGDEFFPRIAANKKENEFLEPEIEWQDSNAKRILHGDTMNGLVPKEARDQQNKSTMLSRDICDMHPEEHHLHDCKKFSSRLSRLRKAIKKLNSRAEDDKRAFDIYVANHPVSLFSSKGHIQCQALEICHDRSTFDDGRCGYLENVSVTQTGGIQGLCHCGT